MIYRIWNQPIWISHNQEDAFVMLQAFSNVKDLEFGNLKISVNDIVVSRIEGRHVFFVSLESFEPCFVKTFFIDAGEFSVVYSSLNLYSSLKNGCWIHDPIERRVS